MENRPIKNLRIYACGGMATNVCKAIENYPRDEPGFATTSIVYVDTSNSNLDNQERETYILRDLDGSGKVRKENAAVISNTARDILQQHNPGDFNIVISSANGGSGSVISPLLTKALLEKDHPTVVILVGGTATHIEAQNSMNTLKSFEAISKQLTKPIVLSYFENSEKHSRKQVDTFVMHAVNDLKVLFSGQNRELDSKDLFNWLRYEKATSSEPKLSALTILSKNQLNDVQLGNVNSVAILSAEEDDHVFPHYTEYRCTGFVPSVISQALSQEDPLYYIVSDGPIQSAYKHLSEVVEKMEEQRKARVKTSAIISEDDKPTEDGLVL